MCVHSCKIGSYVIVAGAGVQGRVRALFLSIMKSFTDRIHFRGCH